MKRIFILGFIIIVLSGCGPTGPTAFKTDESQKTEFTDALDHRVTVSDPDRVVVASGSFAQVWLLAGGSLIGTTRDAFTEKPEISDDVAYIGDLHNPSVERILSLEPQLVILSADIPSHVKLYEQLSTAGILTAYFSVEVFQDYLDMLKTCTDITGRSDLYKQNGLQVRSRIQEIIAQAAGKHAPKILLLRSNATHVTARNSDTMAGAMLKDMGCVNIADSENGLLANLSMEVIIQEDPDFIFATYMGQSEEKAQQSLQNALLSNPAWANLTAVKNNHYIILPKELFHLKPNNRWAESYELLEEILYAQ